LKAVAQALLIELGVADHGEELVGEAVQLPADLLAIDEGVVGGADQPLKQRGAAPGRRRGDHQRRDRQILIGNFERGQDGVRQKIQISLALRQL
jgi:hypothetical protein